MSDEKCESFPTLFTWITVHPCIRNLSCDRPDLFESGGARDGGTRPAAQATMMSSRARFRAAQMAATEEPASAVLVRRHG